MQMLWVERDRVPTWRYQSVECIFFPVICEAYVNVSTVAHCSSGAKRRENATDVAPFPQPRKREPAPHTRERDEVVMPQPSDLHALCLFAIGGGNDGRSNQMTNIPPDRHSAARDVGGKAGVGGGEGEGGALGWVVGARSFCSKQPRHLPE